MAAVLACNGGVLSHGSAAGLLGPCLNAGARCRRDGGAAGSRRLRRGIPRARNAVAAPVGHHDGGEHRLHQPCAHAGPSRCGSRPPPVAPRARALHLYSGALRRQRNGLRLTRARGRRGTGVLRELDIGGLHERGRRGRNQCLFLELVRELGLPIPVVTPTSAPTRSTSTGPQRRLIVETPRARHSRHAASVRGGSPSRPRSHSRRLARRDPDRLASARARARAGGRAAPRSRLL